MAVTVMLKMVHRSMLFAGQQFDRSVVRSLQTEQFGVLFDRLTWKIFGTVTDTGAQLVGGSLSLQNVEAVQAALAAVSAAKHRLAVAIIVGQSGQTLGVGRTDELSGRAAHHRIVGNFVLYLFTTHLHTLFAQSTERRTGTVASLQFGALLGGGERNQSLKALRWTLVFGHSTGDQIRAVDHVGG